MIAAELYEKTLQDYVSLLPVLRVSLSTYCRAHRVYYRGLVNWMRKDGIPLPPSNHEAAPVLPVCSFAPVSILPPQSPAGMPRLQSPAGVLKGVRIALPNGIHVSIRQISGEDMTGLIHSLNAR